MYTSDDDDLNDRYDTLCRTVGHLFICFARLEGAISAVLKLHLAKRLANSSNPNFEDVALSSTIFGSMRFKAARDIMNRIATASDLADERSKFLKSCFEQVGHLEKIRDSIAHQQIVPSAFPNMGEWQLLDALTTKDVRRPKIFVFDAISVSKAARDLVIAAHRISGSGENGMIFDGDDFDTTPIVWQYKPSMLKLVPHSIASAPLAS